MGIKRQPQLVRIQVRADFEQQSFEEFAKTAGFRQVDATRWSKTFRLGETDRDVFFIELKVGDKGIFATWGVSGTSDKSTVVERSGRTTRGLTALDTVAKNFQRAGELFEYTLKDLSKWAKRQG